MPKKTDNQEPCRCKKMKCWARSVRQISYRCACGQTRLEKNTTAAQRKQFMNSFKTEKNNNIHGIYHDFKKNFPDGYSEGSDMMDGVEEWAKKHPSVVICGCDDDHHAGSDLVIIPHENKYKLWGVTVVYIPQCTGEPPTRFFLYPNHLKGLLEGLGKMVDIAAKHGNKNLSSFYSNPKEPKSFDDLPPIDVSEAKRTLTCSCGYQKAFDGPGEAEVASQAKRAGWTRQGDVWRCTRDHRKPFYPKTKEQKAADKRMKRLKAKLMKSLDKKQKSSYLFIRKDFLVEGLSNRFCRGDSFRILNNLKSGVRVVLPKGKEVIVKHDDVDVNCLVIK